MPPVPPPDANGLTATTGVPLYWCRYGPRAPRGDRPANGRLLVLHGGPGAHHDYLLPQMLALADDRECVFYDQRGGGRSRSDERTPITWRTHVEDLARVAAEVVPGSLTLVGYSWGALLAMLYAIEATAGRVAPVPRRMILLDPGPVSRSFRGEFEVEFARRQGGPEVTALRASLAASGLRASDPDAFRQRTFELSVAGYFADPTRARDLTPFRVTGRVQQSVWESLGDYDLLTALRGVRIPSLIVHGRQDPIPWSSAAAAADALEARTLWLDACGHVPYVERSEVLFPALRRFLDDTESLVSG